MKNLELSICIPTRNFGQYIHETLESIVSQSEPQFEVIVLDGGSTDRTPAIVGALAKRYPFIHYYRQESASGIDRDLATAIRVAKGRYVWLMSADDVPKPGSIRRVLNEIQSGHDTYLCNRTECDIDLRPIADRFWLDRRIGDWIIDFHDPGQVIKYFQASQSLGAIFSYISTIVFVRDRWEAAASDNSLVGSNYRHAHALLRILKSGGSHKYIRDQLVYCRSGNDSFLEPGNAGIVKRYLIDVDGYFAILSSLDYPVKVRYAFSSIMRKEHPWFMWIRVAIRLNDEGKWKEIAQKLLGFGYSPMQLFLIGLSRIFERVVPVFALLRSMRKKFSD